MDVFLQVSFSVDLEVFLDQKNHILFEDVSVWICVLICFGCVTTGL